MPGENVRRDQQVCMVGPGLRAALSLLGEPGKHLLNQWSSMTATALMNEEASAARLLSAGPSAAGRPSAATRWTVYGRCGVACALLRRAGREARAEASVS